MVTNSSRKGEGEDKKREGNYRRGGEEDWMQQGWVGSEMRLPPRSHWPVIRALSRPTQRDPPELTTMCVDRLSGMGLLIYVEWRSDTSCVGCVRTSCQQNT